jgi:hypothetical protein
MDPQTNLVLFSFLSASFSLYLYVTWYLLLWSFFFLFFFKSVEKFFSDGKPRFFDGLQSSWGSSNLITQEMFSKHNFTRYFGIGVQIRFEQGDVSTLQFKSTSSQTEVRATLSFSSLCVSFIFAYVLSPLQKIRLPESKE